MGIRCFCASILLIIALSAPTGAAQLSTEINSINSGGFPTINSQIKVFCNEITSLGTDNFTLSEDGKPVSEFSVTLAKPKQYYILNIDRSSSIKQDMPIVQHAVFEFLRSIPAEVSVGIISFASDVQLEHEFSTNRKSLANSVKKISAWGGTALYDALFEGVQRLKSQGEASDIKTLVCLADGIDSNPRGTGSMSIKTLQEVCDFACENSTRIITIGLGQEIDERALKLLAAKTKGAYLKAPDAQKLKSAYQAISKRAKFERYYAIQYKSPNPIIDGKTRELKITSLFSGSKGQGTGSYTPTTAQTTNEEEAKKEPETIKMQLAKLGIHDRPLAIAARPLNLDHRQLDGALIPPSTVVWDGTENDGVKIHRHYGGKTFSMETYKDGQKNGSFGSWYMNGAPTGQHGTMLNGSLHGEVVKINYGENDYTMTTYDRGNENGPTGQYYINGTPKGDHGTKLYGAWHGKIVRINYKENDYTLMTFDQGNENGPTGQYYVNGTPKGDHGTKENGVWQGQKVRIQFGEQAFSVENYDQGNKVSE